jgi:hypothetical protein
MTDDNFREKAKHLVDTLGSIMDQEPAHNVQGLALAILLADWVVKVHPKERDNSLQHVIFSVNTVLKDLKAQGN